MTEIINVPDLVAEILSHVDLQTWIKCQYASKVFHVTRGLKNILMRTPFQRKDYFNILDILHRICNKPLVLLIQIGAFYEIYGKEVDHLLDLSVLLNCQIGYSFSLVNRHNTPQIGFPTLNSRPIATLKQSNYAIILMVPAQQGIGRFYLVELI